MQHFDVQVHGAGIVGQSLALALAGLGLRIALRPDPAASAAVPEDVRAYALNAASVALLRRLKVWDALPAASATPVYDMHVEGDAPGAVLEFSGWQQRVGELAWIVDAAALQAQLAVAVRYAPHVTLVGGAGSTGPDDTVQAPLTALCEGRSSARREALGVAFERQPYGHQAIAARLTASVPHRGTARQWFRSPDVLALLPLDAPQPGASYALVWSMPDAQAEALLAATPDDFCAALNDAVAGRARHGASGTTASAFPGTVSTTTDAAPSRAVDAPASARGGAPANATGTLALASPRQAWPLQRATAAAWSGPGWVLLGDAAHVVHPLAGQGLNLGLADVQALARVIAEREPWRGVGDARLLRRYERERRLPVQAMSQLTDGLLQLFAAPEPLARELRNRGLGLVNAVTPIKRWLAARALGGPS